MQLLHYQTYRKKLRGCYIGKAVGGTLGMPYEGKFGIRPVDYYDPVPVGMAENDDLDLQAVTLEVLRSHGLPVNRLDLANGYRQHLRALWDEYGVAMRNLYHRLGAPLSGSFDNKFTDGMGAAIRTELWAGLAPGDPALAVRLAAEDACVDHAGDGAYAAWFLAAVESAAYTCSDPRKLLKTGLSFLPKKSRLASALRFIIAGCNVPDADPFALRERLLSRYYVQNWTDVTLNLCIIVIAWLLGNGTDALRLAAELGGDADCTCATLGAILGILNPDGFEEKWTRPIGDRLTLSSNIAGMHEPADVDTFCHRIAELATDVLQTYRSAVVLKNAPFFSRNYAGSFLPDPYLLQPPEEREALIMVRPLLVTLSYPESVAITPGVAADFTLHVADPTGRLTECGLRSLPCDGMSVLPRNRILRFDERHCAAADLQITLESGRNRRAAQNDIRFLLEANGLTFDCKAGIPSDYAFYRLPCEHSPDSVDPTALDWTNASLDRSPTHTRPIPPGSFLYQAEFRNPVAVEDALLAVTGTRPMAVWLDGKLILEHDGIEYVPAFHRSDNVISLALDASWHKLTIWTGEASMPARPTPEQLRQTNDLPLRAQRYLYDRKKLVDEGDGELFVGFASRRGLAWLSDMEWRV